MKIEAVEIKVFLGYFTLIILASLIIWVVYSEILQNYGERVDINPVNNKFIYINNIVTNLYQAEGLERSYAQTGQKKHYQYYLKLMDTIGMQIDTLALMVNNATQQMHTDSIKKLLLVKKRNLKELANIKNRNSSTVRYQQAIEKLSTVKDSIDEPQKVYKNIITDRDSVYLKQKKKNFFERLANVFAAQNKTDSDLHVRTTQSVQIDSLVSPVNTVDTITDFITAIVTEIRDESLAVETRLKQKEQEILANDLIITFQLRQLLSNIEKEELDNSFQKVKAQQNRLVRATWMIILVGSFALISIIFFLVNILKDISKSQHYRQSLEKAKAYSESLLKSKEQFMLSLTHDLKSPLGSIIGFTGLMERGDGVSSQQQKYLQRINKASNHILKLVNDLLDLARLDSGKLAIERLPFDLKQLIDDIVEEFRPLSQTKNIELQLQSILSSSAIYKGDPVRITQIVSNLVSNALKFTEKGKVTVRVSAHGFSKKNDRIRIDVIDTGIGISQENIQLIFEEFARVTNTKKQYEGTGLGLTITQKIVHLLNGTIHLESILGKGSHFFIELPLEKSEQLLENAPKIITDKFMNENTSIAPKTVWVIDDDETLLEMTSILLRSEGMDVQSFSNPEKALDSFTKGCTCLLVIDIQMPVINGVELLAKIQEKNGGPITAIAISGMDAGKNGYAGFSAFIQKPFHPKTLVEVISGQHKKITVTDSEKKTEISYQKGYSLDQFAAFASGDPESLKQILGSFIDSGKRNVNLLRKSIEAKNEKEVSDLSHKMLTLFRQLKAQDIVELLAQLEDFDEFRSDQQQYFLLGRLAIEKIETLLNNIQIDENISHENP